MLFANPQGVGELYKIHGSYETPDSLVLTAEDYARFEDRNPYLAAKLLTIFVEHPVIFLGYSLQDPNVLSVLQSIARCLTQGNIDQLRDRLLFVQWDPTAGESVEHHTIVVDHFIFNVIRLQVPDFVDVFTSLSALSRSFPAKLLRRLKEHVYQLVLTDDPDQRLFVADIEGTTDKDIDVVFGVGMKDRLGHVGYVGLRRTDLVEDILSNGNGLDPRAVISEALPLILRQPGNVPVFKYLRTAGHLGSGGEILNPGALDPRIVAMAERMRGGRPASAWHQERAAARLASVDQIAELEVSLGAVQAMNWALSLPADKIDPAELRTFLSAHPELRHGSWNGTRFVKLVCFLDWLENGRGKS
jgi:hypothetical protein